MLATRSDILRLYDDPGHPWAGHAIDTLEDNGLLPLTLSSHGAGHTNFLAANVWISGWAGRNRESFKAGFDPRIYSAEIRCLAQDIGADMAPVSDSNVLVFGKRGATYSRLIYNTLVHGTTDKDDGVPGSHGWRTRGQFRVPRYVRELMEYDCFKGMPDQDQPGQDAQRLGLALKERECKSRVLRGYALALLAHKLEFDGERISIPKQPSKDAALGCIEDFTTVLSGAYGLCFSDRNAHVYHVDEREIGRCRDLGSVVHAGWEGRVKLGPENRERLVDAGVLARVRNGNGPKYVVPDLVGLVRADSPGFSRY